LISFTFLSLRICQVLRFVYTPRIMFFYRFLLQTVFVSLFSLNPLAAQDDPDLPPVTEKPKEEKWLIPTGPVKLDDMLRYPGSYGQVCDVRVVPVPAPIPGFRQIVLGEAHFSERNLAWMKSQRKSVLGQISERLRSISLFQKATEQPTDPNVPKDAEGNYEADGTPQGVDPKVYSGLLLELIQELDGVEALPAVLEFEAKFYAAVQRAEKDPEAPLPTVDGGGGVVMEGLYTKADGELLDPESLPAAEKAALERKSAVHSAVAAHRDILAVLVRLMRKLGYQPMLDSPLEAEYGRLLKERWSTDEEMKKFKSAEDIPKEDRESIKFDPLHKVAYPVWEPVNVPFDEGKREIILKLAAAFAKAPPAAAATEK
jgi:hypothetical protein